MFLNTATNVVCYFYMWRTMLLSEFIAKHEKQQYSTWYQSHCILTSCITSALKVEYNALLAKTLQERCEFSYFEMQKVSIWESSTKYK